MKKILLIIFVTFISLFMNFMDVKAEDVELKCTYKNPFGGEDIEIIFTNYKNDYLDGKTGKTKSGIYVSEGGSFSSVVKAVSYLPWNSAKRKFNVENAQIIDGKLWAFDEYFIEKDQVESSMKNGNSYSCPSLMYSTDITDDNVDSIIIHMANSFYCSDSATAMVDCNSMLLVDGSIIDEEGTKTSKIDDCSFDFRVPNVNRDYSINFDLYSDNSIKWSAKGVNGDVNFNLDYPVYFYDKENRIIVKIDKDDIKKLLSSDGSKLTCKNGSVCELNISLVADHEYIITSDINKCPKRLIDGSNNANNTTTSDGAIPGSTVDGKLDPTKPSTNVSSACVDYLGHASNDGTIAHFLDNIWDIIKYGSIILVIVFAMIDFAKAASNDKEKMPVVLKRAVMRLIFLVVLLMLPTIVEALGSLAGVDGILCGIK